MLMQLLLQLNGMNLELLDLNNIKKYMKKPVMFDLRNIYNKKELNNIGFEYYGIGK